VDLGSVPVSREGTIGIHPREATNLTRVTAWPAQLIDQPGNTEVAERAPDPSGAGLALMRGSRVLRVAGKEVQNFGEIAAALVDATRDAFQRGDASARVRVEASLPVPGKDPSPVEGVEWTIPAGELRALHTLAWSSPLAEGVFERREFTLIASNPGQAISKGLKRTQRVMMQTYLTFSRLFQGTVKVEHLKGPVGIAHIGTMVANRGFVHLLFFMALISVNLGVVNFLPIPIADGGHFLFLLYEQVTGKPVSVAFQNIATLAGLILIASLFLLVTYNDIANVFR
jgi:regulator of sigma E protease